MTYVLLPFGARHQILLPVKTDLVTAQSIQRISASLGADFWASQIYIISSRPVYRDVARFKSIYKGSKTESALSLADAIGLATAIDMKGVFVTTDGGFLEPEAAEQAPVFWFRPPKQKN
ncbi:hypothetical protein AGMMS50267_01340 [Spirochaetia bacterium]|nr:hypothetical protein AGMMS50267_01340 [Spirochaetia bacterium]